MLSKIATASRLAITCAFVLTAQQAIASDESATWEAVKANGTSTDVFAFIEEYPNGAFVQEAKAYMIDLLWIELAETKADAGAETVVEVAVERTDATTLDQLTFTTPLTEAAPEIVGKSFEEIVKMTPLFPPVEGLPEEYWKNKDCSACHQWEQANLCTQANTYLSDAGGENLMKEHPFGGSFKLNLRSWALNDCE